MTRETQLVLALCRTPPGETAKKSARDLIGQGLDWDLVFAIAGNFEVEPVFFSNLRSLAGIAIPADVIDRAAIRERNTRAFALSRTLLLVDLYTKLTAAGVPIIVLKGPALGVTAYGDPSMRTYQDIDFLTTRDALPKGRDLLLRLGYARDYEPAAEASLINGDHALEFSGPGGKVELHCALIERHLRLAIDGPEIWKESISVPIAGVEVSVLDPSRQLLFVCAHGTKHEWSRVRWICDVAQIADRLSASEVTQAFAIAEKVHARRILALGLRLAREVLGQSLEHLPDAFTSSDRSTDHIVAHARRQSGLGSAVVPTQSWLDRIEPGAGSLVYWARTRERWIDRIACVGRVFLVPTAADGSSGGLAWITRPIRLSLRFARRALGSMASR